MKIRCLGPQDIDCLAAVEPGLFDHPVDSAQARAFLTNPRQRIAVALEAGRPVASAPGTVLLHPDKPPALFVNELGTEPENGPARALCRNLGGDEMPFIGYGRDGAFEAS